MLDWLKIEREPIDFQAGDLATDRERNRKPPTTVSLELVFGTTIKIGLLLVGIEVVATLLVGPIAYLITTRSWRR
jgi:hypothetical protein